MAKMDEKFGQRQEEWEIQEELDQYDQDPAQRKRVDRELREAIHKAGILPSENSKDPD
jgi:hypothetical protein